MPALYTVENLNLHYLERQGMPPTYAVEGVSFELQKGEVLGIAGESGCGKSTLVQGALCLHRPPLHYLAGDIRIQGESLVGYSQERLRQEIIGRRIAQIPQGALNALNPTRKIKDFAFDVIRSHYPSMGKKEIHARLYERFLRLELEPKRLLNAYPVELSGGMKQRVVIAISTLMNPAVLLADEPTSALDVSTQKSVIELLMSLLEMEIIQSMVFVTHELPILRHIAHRIAIMYAGELVEVGTTEQVLFSPKHPYTRILCENILVPELGATEIHRPTALEGAPPDLQNPPKGCRFAARCPLCKPDCVWQRQALRTLPQDQQVRCAYAQ